MATGVAEGALPGGVSRSNVLKHGASYRGSKSRDGTTLRRWSFSRAWPVKFVAGDWDNEADESVIESVTLPHDFFEFVQ